MLVAFFEISAHEPLRLDDNILHQGVVFCGRHLLGQRVHLFYYVASVGFSFGTECLKGCPTLSRALTFEDINVEIGELGYREIKVAAAVRIGMKQVGACPIKHGHEVITNGVNAFGGQVAQTFLVNFNLVVAIRAAIFNRLCNGK